MWKLQKLYVLHLFKFLIRHISKAKHIKKLILKVTAKGLRPLGLPHASCWRSPEQELRVGGQIDRGQASTTGSKKER